MRKSGVPGLIPVISHMTLLCLSVGTEACLFGDFFFSNFNLKYSDRDKDSLRPEDFENVISNPCF